MSIITCWTLDRAFFTATCFIWDDWLAYMESKGFVEASSAFTILMESLS